MNSKYARFLLPAFLAVLSAFSSAQAQPGSGASSTAQQPPAIAPGSEYKEAYRLAQQGKYAEALSLLNSMSDKNAETGWPVTRLWHGLLHKGRRPQGS